jgi:hypothetical protein
MPHPHLAVLRSAATLLLSCIIGQAGWAAAFLGGQGQYFRHHQVGAWVTLVVAVGTAVIYLVLRRSAGPVNLGLAIATAVVVSVQYALGQSGDRALHIFVGVLLAMLGTALTSWTYRHAMPATVAQGSGPSPGSARRAGRVD